jgi:hypothetical protein
VFVSRRRAPAERPTRERQYRLNRPRDNSRSGPGMLGGAATAACGGAEALPRARPCTTTLMNLPGLFAWFRSPIVGATSRGLRRCRVECAGSLPTPARTPFGGYLPASMAKPHTAPPFQQRFCVVNFLKSLDQTASWPHWSSRKFEGPSSYHGRTAYKTVASVIRSTHARIEFNKRPVA